MGNALEFTATRGFGRPPTRADYRALLPAMAAAALYDQADTEAEAEVAAAAGHIQAEGRLPAAQAVVASQPGAVVAADMVDVELHRQQTR